MVLAAIVVIVQINKSEAPKSTIPQQLVLIDSAELNRLVIVPKDEQAYELVKSQGNWELKLPSGKNVAIESKLLKGSIGNLLSTKPKRVVTRSQEKWNRYEVTDSTAIKIEFYNNNNKLAALYIGKFDFNQQTRAMSNFVRAEESNDVLMVESALSFDWNKNASDWRNKKVLSTSISSINKVEANGLFKFTLVNDDATGWITSGIEMDTVAIESYINNLATINAQIFDDEISLMDMGEAIGTFNIFTEKENHSISIYNTPRGKRLVSSQNPQNIFVFDKSVEEKLIPHILLSTTDQAQ